ncbi:MAG: acetyltransferase [Chloroflexi bacterium]|nr:acetyltransferase [Chloroflexota bacterium]
MSEEKASFQEWAILEQMGHIRTAGLVSEVAMFGVAMGRIDIPHSEGDGFTTQFFGGQSVYRLTPTTEEIARHVARGSQPAPVHRWELAELPAGRTGAARDVTPHYREGDDEGDLPY